MKKSYVIELRFDNDLNNEILDTWNYIKDLGMASPNANHGHIKPHIVLAAFQSPGPGDILNILYNFTRKQYKFPVILNSFRYNTSDCHKLFLVPSEYGARDSDYKVLYFTHRALFFVLIKNGYGAVHSCFPCRWIPVCPLTQYRDVQYESDLLNAVKVHAGYAVSIAVMQIAPGFYEFGSFPLQELPTPSHDLSLGELKTYAIELRFNDELEAGILNAWKIVNSIGMCAPNTSKKIVRPHITLAVIKTFGPAMIQSLVYYFTMQRYELYVLFTSTLNVIIPAELSELYFVPCPKIGKPPSSEGAPRELENLHHLHKSLCYELEKNDYQIPERYRPGTWIPGCPVVQNYEWQSMDFSSLMPPHGYVTSIVLMQVEPGFYEIASFPLQPCTTSYSQALEAVDKWTIKSYAIELRFNDDLKNRILEMWNIVRDHGMCSPNSHHGNVQPHITFAVLQGLSPGVIPQLVHAFTKKHHKFPLSFTSFGDVNLDPNMYLVPSEYNPSEKTVSGSKCLRLIHEDLYETLMIHNKPILEKYQLKKWIPACPLVGNNEWQNKVDVFQSLKALTGYAVSIGIRQVSPDCRELISFPLQEALQEAPWTAGEGGQQDVGEQFLKRVVCDYKKCCNIGEGYCTAWRSVDSCK